MNTTTPHLIPIDAPPALTNARRLSTLWAAELGEIRDTPDQWFQLADCNVCNHPMQKAFGVAKALRKQMPDMEFTASRGVVYARFTPEQAS